MLVTYADIFADHRHLSSMLNPASPVHYLSAVYTIYRIQNKLGVDTKQEMVVWAVKNGLLEDVERDG